MHPLWHGVIPAITTPFTLEGGVDHAFLAAHAAWMLSAGCTGLVALGSLGEGGTLDSDERAAVLETLVRAAGGKPVFAAVAALSTPAAVRQAQQAEALGCRGLMVLPAYVYKGSWRETKAHFKAVIGATGQSCMLYNNPIAYGVDVLPEQLGELASEHANLHAVKESSADVRRITAIRASLGDRLAILVGVDDLVVEGVGAGATGWIAGLVNAFPRESVALFERAARGDQAGARSLYEWFLPLLRMDTGPDFVHLIKLVQQEVSMGSERVRGPRLPVIGEARARAIGLVHAALSRRPRV